MFVVVPFALKQAGALDEDHHWQVYLPIMAVSFLFMVPAIIYGEKKARLKQVFLSVIAVMLAAQLLFAFAIQSFWGVVASLTLYFIAFNILEASLPSIISKLAPSAAKGTAIGVYNTSQSLGVFLGGAVGGWLSHVYGYSAVFAFCSVLMALWLLFALGMRAPPAIKGRMFHVDNMSEEQGRLLAARLGALRGVREAVVLAEEGVALLKVDMHDWDEAAAAQLIGKGE